MSTTHYDILCIDRSADESDVRAAYRRLVKHYHPDIAGAAGVVMTKKLNEAMDVLTNAGQRSDYDRDLDAKAGPQPTAKPKKSRAPSTPAATPIPDADVWRPEHVDLEELRRPHTRAYGWVAFAGVICWALFWVIIVQRPDGDTDGFGFFHWTYAIIAGGLSLLSIATGAAAVLVNLGTVVAAVLWFAAHAPIHAYMPVTEILGGIGSRSLYAEAVFVLGSTLIAISFGSEREWSRLKKEAAVWSELTSLTAGGHRYSMWLVTEAVERGGRTVISAVNESSGVTVAGLTVSGWANAKQYVMLDDRNTIVGRASASTWAAHRDLLATGR